jgi:hypothetical protein
MIKITILAVLLYGFETLALSREEHTDEALKTK